MTAHLPTDQDHGIIIDKHDDGTGWTISRYSDSRGSAYELQADITREPELAALGDYDSEAGCFFATADTQMNAQLIAAAILERLKPAGIPTLEEQGIAENTFLEAAEALDQDHGYSLQDLIELLTTMTTQPRRIEPDRTDPIAVEDLRADMEIRIMGRACKVRSSTWRASTSAWMITILLQDPDDADGEIELTFTAGTEMWVVTR